MDTNLLNIVKQIVFENGESILTNPKRLNPLFKDYAKNESKDERTAFGRCIEAGAYYELKNATTDDDRQKRKISLANQLSSKTGQDKRFFLDSLDILESVIFKTTQNTSTAINNSYNTNLNNTNKISKRTVVFGFVGGIAGGIGTLITELFLSYDYNISEGEIIMSTAVWSAFIGMCISIGLLVAQSIYQKKKTDITLIIKTALIGFGMGAISGAIAQLIYGNTSEDMSAFASEVIRALCWGIMGIGVGFGVSLFVPNYPKKRAIIAGFVGGFVGSIFFIIIATNLSNVFGRFVGLLFLGFFIGFTISVIEESLREAWLTIIWSKNETRTISLGNNPIVLSSSPGADIYISKDTVPPVMVTVQIENSKVVMYDKNNNKRKELQNGDKINLGKVSFVVNVKK